MCLCFFDFHLSSLNYKQPAKLTTDYSDSDVGEMLPSAYSVTELAEGNISPTSLSTNGSLY